MYWDEKGVSPRERCVSYQTPYLRESHRSRRRTNIKKFFSVGRVCKNGRPTKEEGTGWRRKVGGVKEGLEPKKGFGGNPEATGDIGKKGSLLGGIRHLTGTKRGGEGKELRKRQENESYKI